MVEAQLELLIKNDNQLLEETNLTTAGSGQLQAPKEEEQVSSQALLAGK